MPDITFQRVRLVYELMVERSFYLVKTVFDKIIKKAMHPFKKWC